MRSAPALRSPAAAILSGLGLCAVLGLAVSQPGYTDDRDLLRFASSKPYLFILLDTSSSMNLKIGKGDTTLLGNGDNPDSRIYAAKQALYNVFTNVDDVFFGFASLNQDFTRVVQKHLVYYNPGAAAFAENAFPTTQRNGQPGAWPLTNFPAPDPDGLTQFEDKLNLTGADVLPPIGTLDNVDGIRETVVSDLEGDPLTFGPLYDFNHNNVADVAEQTPPGNNCSVPLPLGALGDLDRTRIDAFSLLNVPSDLRTTTLWVTPGANKVYRVEISWPTRHADNSANNPLGQDDVTIQFDVDEVTGCNAGVPSFGGGKNWQYLPILKQDQRFDQFVSVDGAPSGAAGGNAPAEAIPNLWPTWTDAITNAVCDNNKPFSGKGWEGNYDSNDTPPAGVTLKAGFPTNEDRFCTNNNDPSTCVEIKPVLHTAYSSLGRAIDRGDVLPFSWTTSNKGEFLKRLAPNDPVSVDFGVAHALRSNGNTPPLFDATGVRAPLIAEGNTQLGKAILDFRCWYLGTNGQNGNKCDESASAAAGWSEIACSIDPEYGCRRPYLIIISDGDDNCPGENPAADTASLNSHSGVKTWAINLGDPKNCQAGSPLKSVTTNGKGECVNVSDPEGLLTTIQDILGQIREEARAFASAAVPSVQAIAKQALYLTDFTPLNNRSRWPGHLNAFLKPLPTLNGVPDTSVKCAPVGTKTEGCFVWDAGAVLANSQSLPSQRNLFYGALSKSGLWAPNRQPFELNPTDKNVQYDLWRGFGLIPAATITGSLTAADELAHQLEAGTIINATLALQTRSGPCDPTKDLCSYLMGDIFHSDPLVFGASFNADFLRTDAGSQFNGANVSCTALNEMGAGGSDNANFDRGYRCFAARHGFRRQAVYVGSNDGFVRAFNAAQYRTATGRYDNGTGNELFAYMPRPVMPTVKTLAEGPEHHFTVDGPIHASDVFIDPVDDGDGSQFPVAEERRWRTVLMAGLREGGHGYFAIDVTQPDFIDGPTGGPFIPTDNGNAFAKPTCLGFDLQKCGPVAYASPLWEFTDSTHNQRFKVPALQPDVPLLMDEDNNGAPDLAFTWSQPDFARVQICEGSQCTISADPNSSKDVKEHYVAFFGGGLDVDHKDFDPRSANSVGANPTSYFELNGDWIYMVDVETGEVLYKRQLCSPYRENATNATNKCVPAGSVPSALAVIDTDLNGFVDRLYVGTTGGFMFRVDLQVVTTSGSGGKEIKVPALEDFQANAVGGSQVTIKRIPENDSSGNPIWKPYVIFDANWNAPAGTATASLLPRPMYFAPSVIIYQDAGGYALAFGTGDRDDLWNANKQGGRFYLFMDDAGVSGALAPAAKATVCDPSLNAGAICPQTEADYQAVFENGVTTSAAVKNDFIRDRSVGRRGWFLVLPNNERVITDTFSFSGLTFFSSYQPQVALTDANGNPIGDTGSCGDKQYESNTTASCAKTGVSSLFLVSTVNANGLLPAGLRSKEVSSFVTNPFTELTTGNTASNAGGTPQPPPPIPPAIVDLFPKTCRFANARIDISTIAADTSLQALGSVPICIGGHSWKEF